MSNKVKILKDIELTEDDYLIKRWFLKNPKEFVNKYKENDLIWHSKPSFENESIMSFPKEGHYRLNVKMKSNVDGKWSHFVWCGGDKFKPLLFNDSDDLIGLLRSDASYIHSINKEIDFRELICQLYMQYERHYERHSILNEDIFNIAINEFHYPLSLPPNAKSIWRLKRRDYNIHHKTEIKRQLMDIVDEQIERELEIDHDVSVNVLYDKVNLYLKQMTNENFSISRATFFVYINESGIIDEVNPIRYLKRRYESGELTLEELNTFYSFKKGGVKKISKQTYFNYKKKLLDNRD